LCQRKSLAPVVTTNRKHKGNDHENSSAYRNNRLHSRSNSFCSRHELCGALLIHPLFLIADTTSNTTKGNDHERTD
jgi:hypothetical protein